MFITSIFGIFTSQVHQSQTFLQPLRIFWRHIVTLYHWPSFIDLFCHHQFVLFYFMPLFPYYYIYCNEIIYLLLLRLDHSLNAVYGAHFPSCFPFYCRHLSAVEGKFSDDRARVYAETGAKISWRTWNSAMSKFRKILGVHSYSTSAPSVFGQN